MKLTRALVIACAGLTSTAAARADQRPADLPVYKWTPDLTRAAARDFVRSRLSTELGQRHLLRHAARLTRRQLGCGLAARQGTPSVAVDLTRVLSDAPQLARDRVQQIVARIEQRSASTWLEALQRETQQQPDPTVRRALVQVRNAITREALGSSGPLSVGAMRQRIRGQRDLFRDRLADRLLQTSVKSFEGPPLPPLPVSNDPQVRPLLERARSVSQPERQYVYLERQVALLRGSSNEQQRQQAAQLGAYLARYKRGWADRWLQQHTTRFAGAPTVGWDLLGRARFSESLGPRQRATMERRLQRAWRLITGIVHPALLQRIRPFSVRVAIDGFSVPGILDEGGRKVITLLGDSSVKDILHEFGHLIEYYGGLGVYATAHAVRARRGTGRAPVPLSQVLPNTSYGPASTAYEGGFARPYVGRFYPDGYTEVISMGLERFATRRSARRLFDEDGAHVLGLMRALQQPHLLRISTPPQTLP